MVFDLLELGGKDLRGMPLWQRRNMLEALVTGQRAILPVRRLSSDGLKAWAQAVHRGYEGIVGKDPESPYVPGRTLKWLKVKSRRPASRSIYFPFGPRGSTVSGRHTGRNVLAGPSVFPEKIPGSREIKTYRRIQSRRTLSHASDEGCTDRISHFESASLRSPFSSQLSDQSTHTPSAEADLARPRRLNVARRMPSERR